MPLELGARLITAGLVVPDEVEAALFLSVLRGISFARALIDRGAITERELNEELDKRGDLPALNVEADLMLFEALPEGLCRRLAVVPLGRDEESGTVDAAAADPLDPHVPMELAFHLSAPIRVIRATLSAVEDALRRAELGAPSAGRRSTRLQRTTLSAPFGAPDSVGPYPPEIPILLTRRIEDADEVIPSSALTLVQEEDEETIRPLPSLPQPISEPATEPEPVLPLLPAKIIPSKVPPPMPPGSEDEREPAAAGAPGGALPAWGTPGALPAWGTNEAQPAWGTNEAQPGWGPGGAQPAWGAGEARPAWQTGDDAPTWVAGEGVGPTTKPSSMMGPPPSSRSGQLSLGVPRGARPFNVPGMGEPPPSSRAPASFRSPTPISSRRAPVYLTPPPDAPISFPTPPPPDEEDVISVKDDEIISLDDLSDADLVSERDPSFRARESSPEASHRGRPPTLRSPILRQAPAPPPGPASDPGRMSDPGRISDLPTGPWAAKAVLQTAPDSAPTLAMPGPSDEDEDVDSAPTIVRYSQEHPDSSPTMAVSSPSPAPAPGGRAWPPLQGPAAGMPPPPVPSAAMPSPLPARPPAGMQPAFRGLPAPPVAHVPPASGPDSAPTMAISLPESPRVETPVRPAARVAPEVMEERAPTAISTTLEVPAHPPPPPPPGWSPRGGHEPLKEEHAALSDAQMRVMEAPVGPPEGRMRVKEAPWGPPEDQRRVREAPLAPPEGQRRVGEAPLAPPEGQRRVGEAPLAPPDAFKSPIAAFLAPPGPQESPKAAASPPLEASPSPPDAPSSFVEARTTLESVQLPPPGAPVSPAKAHDRPPESSPTLAFTASKHEHPAAVPVLGGAPPESSPTLMGLGSAVRDLASSLKPARAAGTGTATGTGTGTATDTDTGTGTATDTDTGTGTATDTVTATDTATATDTDVDADAATIQPPPLLPLPDITSVLAALRDAKTRDDVVDQALQGLSTIARRAAVFAVRKDSFRGWACTPSFADQTAFRDIVIPQDQPSLLAAAASLAVYLGPVTPTPAHAPLLAVMGRATDDAAAVAARVSGRPVMILFADDLRDTLLATRRMEELARAVGEALTRLLGHRG